MKKILAVVLLLVCSGAFAQTGAVMTRKTMTGAEYAEFMKRVPKITDTKIYDREGNIVDSAKARELVKTFDYQINQTIPSGQTEYKHVLMKVDHAMEARMDASSRLMFRPSSPKLWDGVILDLTPLAKHTDISKLDGKAVVLLFRNRNYGYMYKGINDAIANFIDGNKFEVFAITNLDYASAKAAQKAAPILNARYVVDAQDLIDFYETGGDALIVVTNAKHEITYAAKGGPAMVPRTLNKLLKEL
ncbi:hypothetical protein [Mucilaginibacter panaciglaebae]|uniref:Redoxin domain-containing protein n=1 Tax=Mucilaginibacter panaciglaebae TaxID=502331 RepID=A0ABP7X482_9SPHI